MEFREQPGILRLSRIRAQRDAIPSSTPPYAKDFFSGAASQLRWQDLGASRLIQGDVNGDSIADLTIFVAAPGPVDAAWFVLQTCPVRCIPFGAGMR